MVTADRRFPQSVIRAGKCYNFIDKPMRAAIEPWYFDYWSTSLGWLKACASDTGLFSLSWSGNNKPPVSVHMAGMHTRGIYREDVLSKYKRNLVAGEDMAIDIDLYGTCFQCQVWRALLDLPVQKTISYSELARLLGRPHGQRAVGSAVGANPVFLFVPCHRVIAHDATLGGYAYGLALKQYLLATEQQSGNELSLLQA